MSQLAAPPAATLLLEIAEPGTGEREDPALEGALVLDEAPAPALDGALLLGIVLELGATGCWPAAGFDALEEQPVVASASKAPPAKKVLREWFMAR